jgi:hypothetical protein
MFIVGPTRIPELAEFNFSQNPLAEFPSYRGTPPSRARCVVRKFFPGVKRSELIEIEFVIDGIRFVRSL